MLALIITYLWQDMGYNLVIFIAGLQSIPDVFHEAARVDGANAWQRFRHITLPLLRSTLTFVIVLTMLSSWQVFVLFQVMTQRRAEQPHAHTGPAHLRDRFPLPGDGPGIGDGDGALRLHHGRHADPAPCAAPGLGVLNHGDRPCDAEILAPEAVAAPRAESRIRLRNLPVYLILLAGCLRDAGAVPVDAQLLLEVVNRDHPAAADV